MKNRKARTLVLVIFSILQSVTAKAQPLHQDDSLPGQNQESVVSGDLSEPVDLYQIVDSPALRHLLSAGTIAANKAVTNAMDALFYSLLDRTWPISRTRFAVLNTGIERKLTALSNNTYLVVDRMMIGPSLARPILPPTPLGIGSTLSSGAYFYEFYIVSDPERVAFSNAKTKNLFSVANWFGILPLLTRILPPSFDANELYNPLRVFKTPLKVPLTKNDLAEMPENSMRSYAIKGSIGFPIEHKWILDRLPEIASKTALTPGVPVNFYADAMARVTVQKQPNSKYRVSLSHINTEGQSIGLEIGKTFYAFGLAAGKFSWKGLPIPIFPLKSSIDQTLFQEFSQIRDIDLTNDLPDKIISEALTGNFINLDQVCQQCNQTATSKIGEGRVSKSTNSGFFFDTDKEFRTETADHIVHSPKVTLNYREMRSDRKSSGWDIMNGATTESTAFSWSTPLKQDTSPPLIWGKFSLNFPYIDEFRFSEIVGTLRKLEFLTSNTEKTLLSIENRELENLERIKLAPPLETFSKIYPGPKIVGNLEVNIDLFASDEVIRDIAKMDPVQIKKTVESAVSESDKQITIALCKESIKTMFMGSNGIDICSIPTKNLEDISELSHEILFSSSPDHQKDAAIMLVHTIGVIGFMKLAMQTQNQSKYSFIFHAKCVPHSKTTDHLKERCENEATAQFKKGELEADQFNWWSTNKKDTLEIEVKKIPLELQDVDIKRPNQRSLNNIFEVIFNEPVRNRVYIFIRIESLAKLEIVRSLIFEGIYEVDLGILETNRIKIPKSFFSDANFDAMSRSFEGTRFSINASTDGRNWSVIKKIDIPYPN
jgi:hypothetical protein